jgi:hypothetical protein
VCLTGLGRYYISEGVLDWTAQCYIGEGVLDWTAQKLYT